MHARAVLGLIALTSAPHAVNAQEDPPAQDRAREASAQDASEGWHVRWDDVLKITSPDGAFDIRIGGRIMIDSSWVTADDALEASVAPLRIEDSTEIRRARLFLSGTVYEDVEYKVEYDFAANNESLKDSVPKDVYLGLKNIPAIGNIRIGHQKEPFGLETLTSSRFITFMERALPSNAFAPERNTGFKFQNTVGEEELVYWGVGFFRNTLPDGSDFGDGAYGFTARVAGLPWYEDDGARLFELGFSASYNNFDLINHRSRPENHLVPRFVGTGILVSDDETILDVETALVLDSFSLQGEYMIDDVNLDAGGSSTFTGWYAQAAWFLTGEHRNYNRGVSAWDRVKPIQNFGSGGGSGAWELAARISELDLNDGTVAGGEQMNYTLGVNWYLKPNTRVMLNWVHADVDTVGESDSILMRFQIDF